MRAIFKVVKHSMSLEDNVMLRNKASMHQFKTNVTEHHRNLRKVLENTENQIISQTIGHGFLQVRYRPYYFLKPSKVIQNLILDYGIRLITFM